MDNAADQITSKNMQGDKNKEEEKGTAAQVGANDREGSGTTGAK